MVARAGASVFSHQPWWATLRHVDGSTTAHTRPRRQRAAQATVEAGRALDAYGRFLGLARQCHLHVAFVAVEQVTRRRCCASSTLGVQGPSR